ncbi:MAG TPA: DUF2339 domain-containing protein [Actinomycetota bacterium]|nr:DUF2339 domain-containing protein [Actinomycetota bacterium]
MGDVAELEERVKRLEAEVQALRTAPPDPPWAGPPPAYPPMAPDADGGGVPQPEAELDSEATFFGTWLARLGSMAIVVGLAFGFKYAIDQGWLTSWMRVGLGWAAGLAAVAWGQVAAHRGDFRSFGHAVIAGGIALLYLSTLAGIVLYEILPVGIGVFLLTGIAAGGGLLALRNDSLPLMVMASAAAYGVAGLIGVDHGSPGVVFAYATVVDIGVLGVVVARGWRILSPLAVSASWALLVLRLLDTSAAVGLTFGSLWLLVFVGATLAGARSARFGSGDVMVLVTSTLFYLGLGLHFLSGTEYEFLMGAFTVALSVAWARVGLAVGRSSLASTGAVPTAWGLCIALSVLAVPIQLDGWSTGVAWAVQGALLAWISNRSEIDGAREAAGVVCMLGFLAGLSHLGVVWWSGSDLWSMDTLIVGFHLAGLASAAYLLERRTGSGPVLGRAIWLFAGVLGFGWVTVESLVYAERWGTGVQAVQFGLSAGWTLYAALILCVGIAAQRKLARTFALVLLAAVMTKLVVLDLWLLPPLLRTASFVGLGAVLLVCSLMYHRLLPSLLGAQPDEEPVP